MDGFIFPSIHEGLGIVAVEAQAAGLPSLISEGVPDEAMVSGCAKRLEISAGASKWAETIVDMYRNIPRINRLDEIKKANYDIHETVKQLENIYMKAVHEGK